MGRIIQTRIKKTTTKRVKKVPNGYHKCKVCGGDGICKNRKKGNA